VQQSPWRIEQAGVLTLDIGVFYLVVKQVSGAARFMILRRLTGADAGPHRLLGSGTGDSLQSARAAAERMAARCPCQTHEAPVANGQP